jgi:hypothetical protein
VSYLKLIVVLNILVSLREGCRWRVVVKRGLTTFGTRWEELIGGWKHMQNVKF